ncbi:MAG: potassium channel family protein [Candidatus Nanopelagicales bacterium]
MHVVILGCGRVGSLLADRLDEAGHSVAIVDQDPQSFRRLSGRFSGSTVKGIGFDRETLEKAGIERAHAFAAVSSGDNTNILAARVARETYGVEHVVARIYDPRRAEVYQRLGIPTVATVSWTAGQIMRRLIPQDALEEYRDASGQVMLAEMPAHPSWFGHAVVDMEIATGARVAFISRLGSGLVPHTDMVLQDGDLVHVLAATDDAPRVQAILAGSREDGLRSAREGIA